MDSYVTDRRWTSLCSVFSTLRPMCAANMGTHLAVLRLASGLKVSEETRRTAVEAVTEAVADAEHVLRSLAVLENAGARCHCSDDSNARPTVETAVATEGYHPRWFFLTACECAGVGLKEEELAKWLAARQEVRDFHQGKSGSLSSETRLYILRKLLSSLRPTSPKRRRPADRRELASV